MWKQKIWSSNRELGGVDTEGLCPDLPGPPLPFLVPHSQLLCSFDFKGQWCSHRKPSSLPLHSGKLRDVISLPGLLCGIMLRLLTWSKSHLGLPSFPSSYCSPVPFYYFYYHFIFLFLFFSLSECFLNISVGHVFSQALFLKKLTEDNLVRNELIWSILTDDNSGQIVWK